MRTALLCVVAAGSLAPAAFTHAQSYPAKPVRIIVGFAPGGSTDIVARFMAQRLTEAWSSTVVVENRPGASGMIGAELVAKAAPDGYSLLMSPQTSMAVAPNIFPKINYDPVRDFAAVTIAGAAPMLLVVYPGFPAQTLKDFIALVRARPGQISFGSGGVGTGPHMAGELLASLIGQRMVHIPYKGENPAIIDVAGGQIPFILGTLPAVLPFVQAGRLRVIAATSEKRSALAPQYPTLAESGLPGFDATVWLGLFAPAATPREIVQRLHTDLVKLMAAGDAKEKLGQQGLEFVGNTPAEFSTYHKAELAKWGRIVKEAGIRPQ